MNQELRQLDAANPVPLDAIGPLDADQRDRLLAAAIAPTATDRPSRRTWPLRLLLAAVVTIGLAVPLQLALGLGDRLLGAVFGSPPPTGVQRLFERMLLPAVPAKEGPSTRPNRADLIRSSERLVVRIRTESGRPASLYTARLRTGGYCILATGLPFNGGGCGPYPRNVPGRPVQGVSGIYNGTRQVGSDRFGRGLTFAGRATPPTATALRVVYRDGATDYVPLTHGWFLYEVPQAHERRGHEPVRFDVLDDHDHVLGRALDPFRLHLPAVHPVTPTAASTRVVASAPLHWRRARVVLETGRTPRGGRCLRLRNTRDRIQTGHWQCDTPPDPRFPRPARRLLARPGHGIGWNLGRRVWPGQPGYVYAYGWAAPPTTRIELRFQDSTVQPLPLHDELFLYVVPADRFRLGHRPSYLVGRDRSGRVLYRRFLYPRAHCAYPGADPHCRGIIVWNG